MKYGTVEIKLYSMVKKLISRSLNLRFNTSSSNTPQHLHQRLPPPPNQSQYLWEPPPPRHIKINVDAAIVESHSTLAAIARDCRGTVIKIWAKTFRKSSPILAVMDNLPRALDSICKVDCPFVPRF